MRNFFFLIFILSISFLFSENSKPFWLTQRPIDTKSYIGIGFAYKNDSNYIQNAKNNALNDLSSEININISGSIFNQIIEQNDRVQENFKSEIITSTKADLEGYEIVGSWGDDEKYWVFYKLPKKLYEELKKHKLNSAINQSLDYFDKAKKSENSNQIISALNYYFQALNSLSKYITEPIETNYDGENIFILNEIYYSITTIISNIMIIPISKDIEGKIGKPIDEPLKVKIIYKGESDNIIPNVPILNYFVQGNGYLTNTTNSNQNGYAKFNVTKIISKENIQIVSSELDLNSLTNQDSTSLIFKTILSTFPFPNTQFVLNISGLSFFISSNETNFGESLNIPVVSPKLKSSLSDKGITFIENEKSADYTLTIIVDTKKGSKMFNMFSSFAEISITLVDNLSSKEIYKNYFSKIKGIDIDEEKSGIKALEKASSILIKDFDDHIAEKIF